MYLVQCFFLQFENIGCLEFIFKTAFLIKVGMGAIIKFVLILIVVLYLINKVGKFFYELFFPGRGKEQQSTNNRQQETGQNNRADDGQTYRTNVQQPKNFKGGDYVDFEEIE